MSTPDLLRKLSSAAAAAAGLLASGTAQAAGTPGGDGSNASNRDAIEALRRQLSGDRTPAQVRLLPAGQLDAAAGEMLLAGHSSHSSHVSGSYIRGSGGSSGGGSGYSPSSYGSYGSSSPAAPASTPAAAPAAPASRNFSLRRGTRVKAEVIVRASWGVSLRLADGSRLQVPRRRLSPEARLDLEMPDPGSPTGGVSEVAPSAQLLLRDGREVSGRISAITADRVTLDRIGGAGLEVIPASALDPDTFLALQELGPEEESRLVASGAATAAPTPVATPASPAGGASEGPAVTIKLKTRTTMLVTILSRAENEIVIKTADGHVYRVPAERLSEETRQALGLGGGAPPAPGVPAATPAPAAEAKASPSSSRRRER